MTRRSNEQFHRDGSAGGLAKTDTSEVVVPYFTVEMRPKTGYVNQGLKDRIRWCSGLWTIAHEHWWRQKSTNAELSDRFLVESAFPRRTEVSGLGDLPYAFPRFPFPICGLALINFEVRSQTY